MNERHDPLGYRKETKGLSRDYSKARSDIFNPLILTFTLCAKVYKDCTTKPIVVVHAYNPSTQKRVQALRQPELHSKTLLKKKKKECTTNRTIGFKSRWCDLETAFPIRVIDWL
jgi:hypothetical protein